jgi:hypothetical protein
MGNTQPATTVATKAPEDSIKQTALLKHEEDQIKKDKRIKTALFARRSTPLPKKVEHKFVPDFADTVVWKNLVDHSKYGFVYSPLGLKCILYILYAEGAEQLCTKVFDGQNIDDAHRSTQMLCDKTFVKTGVWCGNKTNMQFIKAIKDIADVFVVDMANVDEVKSSISKWAPEVADTYTKTEPIVIVSTITFKGQWATPFTATSIRPFYGLSGAEELMYLQLESVGKDIRYYTDNNLKIVTMDYKSDHMMVVCQDNYLRTLSRADLESYVAQTKAVNARLRLPKFSATSCLNMATVLENAGTIVQHTKFTVHEHGTEAVACGESVIAESAEYVDIIIDRSFSYYVVRRSDLLIMLEGVFVGDL